MEMQEMSTFVVSMIDSAVAPLPGRSRYTYAVLPETTASTCTLM